MSIIDVVITADEERLKAYLKHGGSSEARDEVSNITLLGIAGAMGLKSVFKILLEAGADPLAHISGNASYVNTPLGLVVLNDHVDLAVLALEALWQRGKLNTQAISNFMESAASVRMRDAVEAFLNQVLLFELRREGRVQ